MTERFVNEPTPFDPSAWDGHTQEDVCEWKAKPEPNENLRDHMRAEYDSRIILQRFLASPNHTPIKRFERGEKFEADASNNQAIVRFTRESYVLGTPTQRDEPYQSKDFWGVVTTLPSGKYMLTRYFVEFASAEEVSPGFIVKEGSITAGITTHQRYETGYTEPDVLFKDTNVVLYSPGKPVAEKKPVRAKLPDLSAIFRPVRPLPHAA